MEGGGTSIQIKNAVFGGRLKQSMLEIEPFLHIEMLENPLTILVVLVNRGPQVDSDASDCNAKHHKQLYAKNVDGQFRFEIHNESSEIEGLDETQYSDKGAIMEDDEQELDEGDPNSNNDRNRWQ